MTPLNTPPCTLPCTLPAGQPLCAPCAITALLDVWPAFAILFNREQVTKQKHALDAVHDDVFSAVIRQCHVRHLMTGVTFGVIMNVSLIGAVLTTHLANSVGGLWFGRHSPVISHGVTVDILT